MPNKKSAEKYYRKSIERNARNTHYRSMVKTVVRYFMTCIQTKEVQKAVDFFPMVVSTVDRMVTKGIFHRNKAARCKSRLNAKLKALVLA
jgi:small subunit ribosomal protein S20